MLFRVIFGYKAGTSIPLLTKFHCTLCAQITLTSNRKSFKERLAESRAAEAQKKFDNAVQKLKAKKAAAALAASAEKRSVHEC